MSLNTSLANSDLPKERPEVLDLRQNILNHKTNDHFANDSNQRILNIHKLKEDSKNGDIIDSDQMKSSKRNPKCAKCANHRPKPVPVKGILFIFS